MKILRQPNKLVLLITLIFYIIVIIDIVLVSNNIFINYLTIASGLLPLLIISSNILSIYYYVKDKIISNLITLILSIFTISGFIAVFYLFGQIMSGF